ncbi:hypothetical protein BaRGS_00032583, partial [Batillaria attramentaria]
MCVCQAREASFWEAERRASGLVICRLPFEDRDNSRAPKQTRAQFRPPIFLCARQNAFSLGLLVLSKSFQPSRRCNRSARRTSTLLSCFQQARRNVTTGHLTGLHKGGPLAREDESFPLIPMSGLPAVWKGGADGQICSIQPPSFHR